MARSFFASHGIDIDPEMERIQFEGKGLWESPFKRLNSKGRSTSWMTIIPKRDSAVHLDDDESTIAPTEGSSTPSIDMRRELKPRNYHDSSAQTTSGVSQASHPAHIRCIRGARLSRKPLLWDLHLADGKISSIEPHDFNSSSQAHVRGILEAEGRLVAPSLCHAHIHLDKCFLLQDPRFADLQIVKGDFNEAMCLTSRAKSRFTPEDLLRRGRRLIEESIRAGVTSMRAFVEVDAEVDFKCLDTGIQLKREYAKSGRMDIQICAFAQVPLFTGPDHGSAARKLMAEAAERPEVDVLGSTPYVEKDQVNGKMNVRWIAGLALKTQKMLDFHLDYYVEESRPPMIWTVLDLLKESHWNNRGGKQITLGHCTRLTLFNDSDWQKLEETIRTSNLPISFVGLPTSDLFMMRTSQNVHHHRGTLPVPEMIKRRGLNAAIAVNNVCNAFTPQGSCDPLTVASSGIGLYSAGTMSDTEILFECVSSRARSAIGLHSGLSLDVEVGEAADLIILDKDEECDWRTRKSIAELVYDPHGVSRTTLLRAQVTTVPPQSAYRRAAFVSSSIRSPITAKTQGLEKPQIQGRGLEPPITPTPTPKPSKSALPDAFYGSRMREAQVLSPIQVAVDVPPQQTSSGLWRTPTIPLDPYVSLSPPAVGAREQRPPRSPNAVSSAYTLTVSYGDSSSAYHYSGNGNSHNSHCAYSLRTVFMGEPRVYHFDGGNGHQEIKKPKILAFPPKATLLQSTMSARQEPLSSPASSAFAYTLSVLYGRGERIHYHFNGGASSHSGRSQSAYTLLSTYGNISRLYHFAGGRPASPSGELSPTIVAKAVSPPLPEKRFSPPILEKRLSFQMPVANKRLSWPAPVPDKPRALRSNLASGSRDTRQGVSIPAAFSLSVRYTDGVERAYHYNGGHASSSGATQSAYTLIAEYQGVPRIYHFDGGAGRSKRLSLPIPRKPQLLRSRTSTTTPPTTTTTTTTEPQARRTTFSAPYTLSTEFEGVTRDYHYNGGAPSKSSSSPSAYALIAEYEGEARMYNFHGGNESETQSGHEEGAHSGPSPSQLIVIYTGAERRYEFNAELKGQAAAYLLSVLYGDVERKYLFDVDPPATPKQKQRASISESTTPSQSTATSHPASWSATTYIGLRHPLVSHPASWLPATTLKTSFSHPASWSSTKSPSSSDPVTSHPASWATTGRSCSQTLSPTVYTPPPPPQPTQQSRSRATSRIPTPRGISRSPPSVRKVERQPHRPSVSGNEASPFMLSANYGDGVRRVYHFNSPGGSGAFTTAGTSAWKLSVGYAGMGGAGERVYYSTYM